MSYILEALKKAEAERNAGMKPGVHLLPSFVAAQERAPAWRRPLPWAAMAALAITLASAGWYAVTRTASEKKAPAEPMPREQAEPAPQRKPPPSAPVSPPAPGSAVVAAAPDITTAVPPPPKAKDEAVVKAPPPPQAEEKPVKKPVEKKRTEEAAPEPVVPALRELPEQIQREIPQLAIGGYIYSGNKADRSVLINNRLLREGDQAAPGLVLERMTPTGMVFNYKGYRYRTGY